MGVNNSNNNNNNEGGEKKLKLITVVLKIDIHCEACALVIVRRARCFDGVKTVTIETAADKLTIIGDVDPSTIQEKLHNKTNTRVDLISPRPKKKKDGNSGGGGGGGGGGDDNDGGGCGKKKNGGGDGGGDGGGGGGGKEERNKINYVLPSGRGYDYGYQTIAYMPLPPFSHTTNKAIAIH